MAREALPQEDDLFSPTSPQKLYKSGWESQKAKGFELRLDSLAFLAAKANRDLASEVSRCSVDAVREPAREGPCRLFSSLSLRVQSVKWGER